MRHLLTMYLQAMDVPWRREISSINYVETSTWAHQEHNGFSHQNPSFIGSILNLKSTVARVYLPPDANCLLSVWSFHSSAILFVDISVQTMAHCLRAKHYVNLVVGSKHPTPIWLSPEEADKVSDLSSACLGLIALIFLSTASLEPPCGSSLALIMVLTLTCTFFNLSRKNVFCQV